MLDVWRRLSGATEIGYDDATYRSNIVITTYEFTLRDRSKLAKVDWKYVVMDEAHRIKDRTSKLADAVDRLQSERRLLLTSP